MFTFELTDNYILIYNHKTKEIIKEEIPYNIISNNKIYDYLKLNKIIIDIINKYKLLNSLFKTNINILIFENKTPTEIYLLKNLFKNLSNININLIHVSSLFDNKHLFISGNKLYYQDKKVERLNNNEYILVGYNENYPKLKEKIYQKYNIKLLQYEDSYRKIFDKVFCLLLIMLIV